MGALVLVPGCGTRRDGASLPGSWRAWDVGARDKVERLHTMRAFARWLGVSAQRYCTLIHLYLALSLSNLKLTHLVCQSEYISVLIDDKWIS